MKAYLAVIKDAFRAAIAAKLLYVMLVLITIFLAVLVPLSFRSIPSSRLRQLDIKRPFDLATRLYEASESSLNGGYDAYIWSQLGERTQERVSEYFKPDSDAKPGEDFNRINQGDRMNFFILGDLQRLIKEPNFYDAEVFADLELEEEGKTLVANVKNLQDEEAARLNRLLLEAVFPLELAKSPATGVRFTYLGMDLPFDNLVVTQNELRSFSNLTIPWILDKLVLSIGVLVAILFTANMVPEMLEPGSLNLLLSKPIRRWGLFISKYLGACVFSFLNACLLFIGIWLILGLRLEIWNIAFLMCIPIYVFVFAIYYSVSASVGLIFRSPILSVISALLFWAFCFGIGVSYDLMSSVVESGSPEKLVVDHGEYVKFDGENRAAVLDRESREWGTAFQSPNMDEVPAFVRGLLPGSSILGLVYDTAGERFLGAQVPLRELGNPFSTSRYVITATAKNDWLAEQKMKAPPLTRAVFYDEEGSLIFVTYSGKVYRLMLEEIDQFRPRTTPPERRLAPRNQPESSLKTDEEPRGTMDYYTDISPDSLLAPEEIELIGWDAATKRLVFYGNGRLTLLKWDGNRYEWTSRDRYGLPREIAGRSIAFRGDHVFIGVDEPSIFTVALESGVVTELPWASDADVVSMVSASDGSKAIVLDDAGIVWQIDPTADVVKRVPVRSQGNVRGISAGDAETFWVIDKNSLVHAYRWSDGAYEKSAAGSMSLVQALYNYGVQPLYWVSPKPGEFYRVVTHLSELTTSRDTDEDEPKANSDSPRGSRNEQDRSPWLPVWNGLAFISVMLMLAVIYFERQDF